MGKRCRLRTAICLVSSRRCGYPGLRAHNPPTIPITQRSRRTYNCGVKQPPHCFPKVLGCVDGTFIKIKPPKENEQDYVNRKGFHSLNVQVSMTICSINRRYKKFQTCMLVVYSSN
ncbi:hypothetical protein FSP39_024105 [Pinctada imbricata]|uniref:DDE Tnp4 domain-containing protein n=1 Tax=Pinctada imbricata TaxID=66713 RepID=A0AA88YL89_PINIB|nr:hypothetical protein FSP39_024105 [Pinctada imbricata]